MGCFIALYSKRMIREPNIIIANGPITFAFNALLISPLKINAIECPNPSPGQYENPNHSNRHKLGPWLLVGSIIANRIRPAVKAIHSKWR